MADQFRTCRRTGCRWPAAASLSFRYATRQVWVSDLLVIQDPSSYDLCPHHSDTVRVPRAWELVDQRTVTEPMAEATAEDWSSSENAARTPALTGSTQAHSGGSAAHSGLAPRRDRYAELWADLPRVAAETGAVAASAVARPSPVGGAAAVLTGHPAGTGRLRAPLSPQLPPATPLQSDELLLAPAPPELEGQLAIPVGGEPPGAVVVSLADRRRPGPHRP